MPQLDLPWQQNSQNDWINQARRYRFCFAFDVGLYLWENIAFFNRWSIFLMSESKNLHMKPNVLMSFIQKTWSKLFWICGHCIETREKVISKFYLHKERNLNGFWIVPIFSIAFSLGSVHTNPFCVKTGMFTVLLINVLSLCRNII